MRRVAVRDTVLEAVFDGEALVELEVQEATSRLPAFIVVALLPDCEDAVKPATKKVLKTRVLSGAERNSSLLAIRVSSWS